MNLITYFIAIIINLIEFIIIIIVVIDFVKKIYIFQIYFIIVGIS